jgi:hypothetical protein
MSRIRPTHVASHTEYARSRFQCLGCGEIVPHDGDRAAGELCSRCRS